MAWDAQTVETAIRQALPEVDGRLCVVDTRPLFNPAEKHQRMHLGTHPANFGPIVYHGNFRQVVRPAALAMLQAMRETNPHSAQVTLVFLCKSGRHRSVACARVAAEVASVYPAFRLTAVTNLTPMSLSSWNCGECAACAFWSRAWEIREKGIAAAVRTWEDCARLADLATVTQ